MDSWPADSPYPLGHYVRTIGLAGSKDVETQVLLHILQCQSGEVHKVCCLCRVNSLNLQSSFISRSSLICFIGQARRLWFHGVLHLVIYLVTLDTVRVLVGSSVPRCLNTKSGCDWHPRDLKCKSCYFRQANCNYGGLLYRIVVSNAIILHLTSRSSLRVLDRSS